MFRSLAVIAVLVACVSGRLYQEGSDRPYLVIKDGSHMIDTIFKIHKLEDGLSEDPIDGELIEEYLPRVRRQARGRTNSDGTSNFAAKIPITGDDKNKLSAIGTVNGASEKGDFKAASGSLVWENVNGHGASLSGEHVPGLGDKMTAAANANLFHNDKQDVTANAFLTKTFPSNPNIPKTDTYGGAIEYKHVNGHSASLSGEHIDGIGDKMTAAGKANLFHNDKHDVTANAFLTKTFPSNPNIPKTDTYGGTLGYKHVNGHSASLSGEHIPGFGDKLTAAGQANLFHNDKHDVTANAFLTKNFPSNPYIPNYDTYGGKVGYTYDDKFGASLGMAHNDLFKKTDYSAMGNLNLFKDRTSSLDLNAGFSKSMSPYFPSRSWEPFGGMSYTKWFR